MALVFPFGKGETVIRLRFYPGNASEYRHLPTCDAAAIFERNLPNAKIDWQAGDELVAGRLVELEEVGAPEVIILGHKTYLGRVAVVTACLSKARTQWVQFSIWPESRIEIEIDTNNESEDALHQIASRIALALGYEYKLLPS